VRLSRAGRGAATVGPVTTVRYRCTACGNLTRFDVTTTRTTRSFHHYTVGGDLVVEEEEVRAETVEDVSCRWCGHGRAVEALTEDVDLGADTAPTEDSGSGTRSTAR
jgi:hypothetical protein